MKRVEVTTNGKPILLVHCLYYILPLNHKRTTSSLASSIFYVAKNCQLKDRKFPIVSTNDHYILNNKMKQIKLHNVNLVIIRETNRKTI